MKADRKRLLRWLGAALAIAFLAILLVETTRNPSRPDRPSERPDGGPGAVSATDRESETGSTTGKKDAPVIRGTVMRADDDSCVAGARVTAHDRSALQRGASWLPGGGPDLLDLRLPGAPVATATAGEDGTFVLRVPHEGYWSVRAEKRGIGDAAVVARTGSDPTLFLRGLAEHAYRIADENDRPVPGAIATVHPWDVCCPPRAEAVSDADGRVRLPTGGDDVLFVRAEGFARRYIEDPQEHAGGTIVLRAAHTVSGVVTNAEGVPVEGVAVRLGCWWNEILLTGEDGRFSFDGIPMEAGTNSAERPFVTLTFNHPDYVEAWHDVVPGDPDAGIVLRRPGKAAVKVKLLPPPDMEGLAFRLRAHVACGGDPVAVPGPDGKFTFPDVKNGVLGLTGEGTRSTGLGTFTVCRGHTTLLISPGREQHQVELHLRPVEASAVAVRVQDPSGHAVAGADVWRAGATNHMARTNRAGLAVLRFQIPSGTPVALEAGHGAWSMNHRTGRIVVPTASAPDGALPVLTLTPGPRLTIVATDAGGGPLRGAKPRFLVLQKQQPSGHPDSGNYIKADPGDPSRATTRIRPDQGYGIVVRAQGYGMFTARYPAPGATDLTLTVRLPADASLQGRLVTQTGKPMRRAYVTVRILTPSGVPTFAGATDEIAGDGGFSVAGLVPARVRITVFEPDQTFHSPVAEVERTLSVAGVTDVGNIVVGALPRVRGVVRDPEGNGLPAAVVLVRKRGEARWLARAITGPDGTFELATPLRPDYVVTFRKDGRERREIALAADTPDRFYTVILNPGR